MRVPYWVELVCRTCSLTTAGDFVYGHKIDTKRRVAQAKSEGWLFRHGDVFCCAACLDRYETETDELGGK